MVDIEPILRLFPTQEIAMTAETIHETVRIHYADAAVAASQGVSCCGAD
jgi:hypothetical protein